MSIYCYKYAGALTLMRSKKADLEAVIWREDIKRRRGENYGKQELIEALTTRIESEKRELEELFQEKRLRELEMVNDLISDAGLSTNEVAEMLQQYIDSRMADVS